MKRVRWSVLLSFLIVLPGGAAEFLRLGKLGSASTWVEGISPDGTTVVGAASAEAVSWTADGGLVSLSGPSILSYAYGASSNGTVIAGYFYDATEQDYRSFRWTSSGFETLPIADAFVYSAAWDISADGRVIVGEKDTDGGREAFRSVDGGALIGLGDFEGGSLNSAAWGVSADGSVVVGTGRSSSGFEAFRWTLNGGMAGLGSLPGGRSYSYASAVSDDGAVVVGNSGSTEGGQAFRWTAGGGMVGLGDLPGGDFFSWANDVSADGSVVVGRSKTGFDDEAFIWDAAHGIRRVQDALEAAGLDLTGWTLEDATGVSADGRTVVGNGTNPEGSSEAWVAVFDAAPQNNGLITRFSIDLSSWNTCLEWSSVSGSVYQIEYCDVLTNTVWQPLPMVTSTSNLTAFVHTNGIQAGSWSRFYRVRLDP
jgi:probable HAF family extracellular repeat protein